MQFKVSTQLPSNHNLRRELAVSMVLSPQGFPTNNAVSIVLGSHKSYKEELQNPLCLNTWITISLYSVKAKRKFISMEEHH